MVYPRRAAGFFLFKKSLIVCDLSQSGTASHNHTRRQRPCEEAAAGGRGDTLGLYTPAESLHVPRLSYARHGVAYLPCQTGRKQRVSGGWEHGACLGPLQASQRQRHVENSALPGSLSSASRRVFRSAVPSDNNCFFFHSLEVLEVKKKITENYHKVFFTYQEH